MSAKGFNGEPYKDYMVLEKVGVHDGESDEDVKRARVVKRYSKYTPRVAEAKMSQDGIQHKGEWHGQLKGARYRESCGTRGKRYYSAEFLGTMERFCASPPANVDVVLHGMLLEEHCTRVVFYNHAFLEEALNRIKTQGGAKLVVDGTFKTNIGKLVLVGVGAVHLVVEKGIVHNRYVPLMFMLSDAEDGDAYGQLLDTLLSEAVVVFGVNMEDLVEDIYSDGSGGAENAIDQILGLTTWHHRDLEHIKRNLRGWKGKFNDPKWREYLTEHLEFTSKMHSKVHFKAVWKNTLRLLEDPALGNEPVVAKYLRKEILQQDDNGDFNCRWRSGLLAERWRKQ